MNLPESCFEKKRITTRIIKDIDTIAFKQDIRQQMMKIDIQNPDLDCVVAEFSARLKSTLDIHAPEKSKAIAEKPRCPWLTDDIRAAKRERRRLEKQLLKDKTPENIALYRSQRNHVNKLSDIAKKSHYQRAIDEKRSNPKDLFNTFNALTGNVNTPVYPKAESDKDSANNFVNYFKEKIDNISNKFDSRADPLVHKTCDIPDDLAFTQFELLTEQEVERYIRTSPSTTCPLDPIPTDLLKVCMKETLPVITQLLNKCLATGKMPRPFKEALVIPLLKKKNLEIQFKNFRPISNLPFLSKVLERVVIHQLSTHCERLSLNVKMQSA